METTQEESPTNGQQETEVTAAPLADRNALIKRRYRTGVVTTLMERSFEIKSIDPKTMVLTRGSAFLPAFNDFVAESDPEAMASPEIQAFVTDVVIEGVTSLNLVKKSLEQCTEEETPIQVLDLDEQVEILLHPRRCSPETANGKAYFISPMVYKTEWRDAPYLKQEVFGPHVAIIPYDTVCDAIRIYNDSKRLL